ncbi:MAG: CopG family transcriptional regulator [Helicobacteraceae bacterium]|nr:CopG family transcriptional regulator [Helicobacteraceae bacterium]
MDDELYKEILSKKVNKKKVSYSLDAEIVETFTKIAKEKKYNKSQIIENLLKSFLQREQEQN